MKENASWERKPLYQCMECERKFYTVKSAQRAVSWGCPSCNSSDIDLYVRK